jgi:hypothetical protein
MLAQQWVATDVGPLACTPLLGIAFTPFEG